MTKQTTEIDLLNIQDAARALGVCQRTVFNFIKQGKLRAVKLGGVKKAGRVLIPKAEIDKLLKIN